MRNATCKGCRCTNQRACVGGCSWFSIEPPVCSACIEAGLIIRPDRTLDFAAFNRGAPFPPSRRDEQDLVLRATGRRLQCL